MLHLWITSSTELCRYAPTYGKKWNQSSLLFTIDDAANDFQPFCYCNSIQMLIKKDKSE